jgi:hypothetical protein
VLRPNLVHGSTTELCWGPANFIALGITEGRVYLGVTRTGLIIRTNANDVANDATSDIASIHWAGSELAGRCDLDCSMSVCSMFRMSCFLRVR